jgi:sarcosine oxidase subunit beta
MENVALDAKACWWGYYEVTPDHDAILGRRPDAPDVVDAAGFSGHGVQHAAAVGTVVAEEIVDGRSSTIDVDALRHGRFGDATRLTETNVV